MRIDRSFRFFLAILAVSLAVWAWCPQMASAGSAIVAVTAFHPVDPEELKMQIEPQAPGAPAIILYHEVFRDDMGKRDPTNGMVSYWSDETDRTPHEDNYYRIKILTEEGRKYADVEIPYDKEEADVVGIHARTIKPDGTIVDFDGKVFDKTVVKARGEKYVAKTFTLPAVELGCVIEYSFVVNLNPEWAYSSSWILSNELFIKSADFTLRPFWDEEYPFFVNGHEQNIPANVPDVKEGTDHMFRLHVENIAAFKTEDFMPPENEEKARVDFSYSLDQTETDTSHYWSKVGKRLDAHLESFAGKSKALETAVHQLVGPDDSPEVKLQKIYARVQQIRNTDFEVTRTDEEKKRAKEKAQSSAEEVWKRGFGTHQEITWLYLALVRAAGMEAYGIVAAPREEYFFDPNLMQSGRLKASLVVIKVNGKNIFADPGVPFTPFGLLPWTETGVQGMQLDKKGPTWVPTLVPTSDQARIERHASLTLSETGDLEGKLTVTYTGVEAANLRLDNRQADDTERKKLLEDTVKGYIPAASEVALTNQPEWKNPEAPLVAEFNLKVPGWATAAGNHFIVTAGLFGGAEKHAFDHVDRIYPVYMPFPSIASDDVDIQVPAGWQVSGLPQGWQKATGPISFSLTAQNNNGKLHLERKLTINFILLDRKYYTAFRNYFQQIKVADDQQFILDAPVAKAAN